MSPLLAALLAGLGISAIALLGFFGILLSTKRLANFQRIIVAFAAGSLLGAAFFHLLPESIEASELTFPITLLGLVIFFVLDSSLWIYHCHAGHQVHGGGHPSCEVKPVGTLNLIGDAIHNITDGVIVGSAFLVSMPLGVVTALTVALHEIPQELSDFGVLLHSGIEKKKALVLNGLAALTILIGILAVFFLESRVATLTAWTVPFAAGAFLYMACTNLLSEIKEEPSLKIRSLQFVLFLAGLAALWLLRD